MATNPNIMGQDNSAARPQSHAVLCADVSVLMDGTGAMLHHGTPADVEAYCAYAKQQFTLEGFPFMAEQLQIVTGNFDTALLAQVQATPKSASELLAR